MLGHERASRDVPEEACLALIMAEFGRCLCPRSLPLPLAFPLFYFAFSLHFSSPLFLCLISSV